VAAGDDQDSKIWRGGGVQFGGYRFGRGERRFSDLGEAESGCPVDRGPADVVTLNEWRLRFGVRKLMTT
jgi:hypothetical protein